jgi:hypothetical protein
MFLLDLSPVPAGGELGPELPPKVKKRDESLFAAGAVEGLLVIVGFSAILVESASDAWY